MMIRFFWRWLWLLLCCSYNGSTIYFFAQCSLLLDRKAKRENLCSRPTALVPLLCLLFREALLFFKKRDSSCICSYSKIMRAFLLFPIWWQCIEAGYTIGLHRTWSVQGKKGKWAKKNFFIFSARFPRDPFFSKGSCFLSNLTGCRHKKRE